MPKLQYKENYKYLVEFEKSLTKEKYNKLNEASSLVEGDYEEGMVEKEVSEEDERIGRQSKVEEARSR